MANQKYDAFLTVARLGSFKAAAEELGYTQAGISYLVNALEKGAGTDALFARIRRRASYYRGPRSARSCAGDQRR